MWRTAALRGVWCSAAPVRWRFDGEIAAFGTASGHRVVVGRWPVSPFGAVSDVMVEAPDGTRLLIAPSDEVARFVASTYRFDSVEVKPVEVVRQPGQLARVSDDLAVSRVGRPAA